MYTEGVLILYTNADTLTNKLNELNTLIKSLQHKPSIIAEVKPKHKWHSNINELQIEGYCMFCNNLDNVNSRGDIIYVDKSLHSSEISIETKFSENNFVKINSDLVIGNIYRSPGSSEENDTELYDLIQLISKKFANFMLVGDVNFNDIDWNKWSSPNNSGPSSQFTDVLRDNFFTSAH